MTDRQLMQQALEALTQKKWFRLGLGERNDPKVEAAIAALSAAIEAAEKQEPVAIVVADEYEDGSPAGHRLEWRGRNEANDFAEGTKFYTAPPAQPAPEFECPRCGHCCPERQWVELTDEEAMQTWGLVVKYAPSEVRLKSFARLIRDKLKEKNT